MQQNDVLHKMIKAGFTLSELKELTGKTSEELVEYAKHFELTFKKTKSHGENLVADIIKQNFPYLVVTTNYNIGRSLYIDVYIESLKLGFEYDGEQHYKKIDFFHKNDTDFMRAVNNDVLKDKVCKKKGVTLVRIGWFFSNEEVKDCVIKHILEAI